MRVKVGENWFEATPNQKIAVELTAAERLTIANMPKHGVIHYVTQQRARPSERLRDLDE